ncbi:hypothetical protein ABT294_11255 [Nonomuraea sp. NPDC000554]|uniref:hypothetical protein n=1 Tax=Nonomuraea sp. NPDC000554 TaxID=3154259 RepID=UPI00331B43AB
MLRKSLSVLLPMVAVVALQAVDAAPASAVTYGCSGSPVGSWPVTMKNAAGGTYYRSDIKLYYNADTGWKCAVLVKRPGLPRYGERTPMSIYMENARMSRGNVRNNQDNDAGRFKYYAGPVKVYGRHLCVTIVAAHGDHTGTRYDEGPYGTRQLGSIACD